jgi:transposase InsO family protein
LRGPLEPAQYTSIDYTQTLSVHRVLASVGSVGDAYDNAMAESFLDSFKTELIADRVWSTRSQLEPVVVEYVGWFNDARLHEADLTAAIDGFRSLDYRYWLARAQTDLAAWLVDQGRSSDAAPLLSEATAMLASLGAAPALARARELELSPADAITP